MSDTPSRVLDFALDTFAAETLVGGLQAFACLVTRLWRTLPSTGCFVGSFGRIATSGTSGSRPPAQAGNFHRFPIFGAFRHRGMVSEIIDNF